MRRRAPAQWCSRVGANLDTLSYDEKRLALDALGVKVRVYKQGSTDEDGSPLPRWNMTMRPAFAAEHVVYGSTHVVIDGFLGVAVEPEARSNRLRPGLLLTLHTEHFGVA